MIDTITSLAISMQTKKGAFALLLGSGISRSASIPTGWDIILNLIERLATAEGKVVGEDSAKWYEEEYGVELGYSDILDRLAKSPAERSQIIRPYIEPTDEERELGLKQPTPAHRAIASLVANGYVRVIVTTNFDRLLESALGDLGIVPAVIASADAINGTLPLAHNDCTIIKIHGDYVDARIRNTTAELASYSEDLNTLLDQVFREYGLVVSGWSGDWDTALREALLRSKSPWFSTYWNVYRTPGDKAEEIIEARSGQVVTNMDADTFFQRLADSVASIEDLRSPELISVAIAEASLKRYIDDPTKRIRLHDLVVGEANRVRRTIEDVSAGYYNQDVTQEEILRRLETYEESTAVLRALFATGCYWGNHAHHDQWAMALERLASFPSVQGTYYEDWLELRYYPALLTLYAGGISALARGNYETLAALLYKPTDLDRYSNEREPLIFRAHCSIMTEYLAKTVAPKTIAAAMLPGRLRFQEGLWDSVRYYLPSEDQFQWCIDRFEYFFGLVHTDLAIQRQCQWRIWGPRGYLPFKQHGHFIEQLKEAMSAEIETEGAEWAPLRAGMFGGSLERLNGARQNFDGIVGKRIYI